MKALKPNESKKRFLCKLSIHLFKGREIHVTEPIKDNSWQVGVDAAIIERCECGKSRIPMFGGRSMKTTIHIPMQYISEVL